MSNPSKPFGRPPASDSAPHRRYTCAFSSELWRVPGPSGWVFATVPEEHAPSSTLGWGRTPVQATVDDTSWKTSVWSEKSGRTVLAVPKRVRGEKDHGDQVDVELEYDFDWR